MRKKGHYIMLKVDIHNEELEKKKRLAMHQKIQHQYLLSKNYKNYKEKHKIVEFYSSLSP